MNTNQSSISHIISTETLLEKYLTPALEQYFYKKLKSENEYYVKLKIGELLKFLSMSHHSIGDIPFSDEIDEVWHLWILQTVQYHELMEKLPAKKYINHSSNDYVYGDDKTSPSIEDDLNRQISYLVSYVTNFGNFTNDTVIFWPMTRILMDSMEFGIEELNEYLAELARIQMLD